MYSGVVVGLLISVILAFIYSVIYNMISSSCHKSKILNSYSYSCSFSPIKVYIEIFFHAIVAKTKNVAVLPPINSNHYESKQMCIDNQFSVTPVLH